MATLADELLLLLEQRVVRDCAGDFLAAVAELRRMLAASDPGIASKLLRLAIPQVEAAATTGVLSAYQLGADTAVGQLLPTGESPVDNAGVSAAVDAVKTVPPHITAPLDGLDARLQDAHRAAVTLQQSGATIEEALSPVLGVAVSVQGIIESQINSAANAAVLQVGQAAGTRMVWEAERDACRYCLSLAGKTVQAGDFFPVADTYADPPPSQVTVQHPPLHRHCRCQISVLNDQSYADALEREAQRSVLRGYALPSESPGARVEAARRLLASDPVAPKSVIQYAQNAVKAGRFPTTEVPEGRGRIVVERTPPPEPPEPPEPPKPPVLDPSGFGRIKPESGLVAAKKTNPLQPTDRAYQINCSHVVNAVELRQRGLDVVATPRPSLQGRYTEETAADWIAPDGQAPPIFKVSSYFAGRDLQGLEENTAHLPKGARGFVRVAWKSGGAHIFNWEKVGDENAPGLKFHEGQVEGISSVQARAYFKKVKPGSVAWFRVDDAEPAAAAAASIEPAAAQAEEAARVKAAKKAEAERKAREEAEWQAMIEERRRQRAERTALLDKIGPMTRLDVMRRFGIDSPEFRAFTREEMRRNNPG